VEFAEWPVIGVDEKASPPYTAAGARGSKSKDVSRSFTVTECDGVRALVVSFNAMARRAHDAPTVLLPVVDGVWIRLDATFEDRLATAGLRYAAVRHRHFRRNCIAK